MSPLTYLNEHGIFGYNWRYMLTHPWKIVELSYYEVKYFIQRGRRGYSDRDNWSIDYYLSGWMPKALRNMKDDIGTPMTILSEMFPAEALTTEGFTEVQCEVAHARWNEILEEMAKGFEASRALSDMAWETHEQAALLQATIDRGLTLFARHFGSLWD